MTTETLTTTADDTNVGQQDVTPEAIAPEVEQGDPAQPNPQDIEEGKTDEAAPAVEYEDFAVPEGVTVDDDVLGEFKGIAKELNLSQQDAQRLADLSAKMAVKQQQVISAERSRWVESSKADKEFGGDALKENLSVAKKALESFASPEMRGILDSTGLGNHPEFIRAFVRIGKAISEDGQIVRGTKADAKSDPANRLFPNQS